jgi:guanylate kinase
MPHVITLTGPSRAGKSTTLEYLLKHASDRFEPVIVPKHTTRSSRRDDTGEVLCQGIPPECDLIYELYGERYGLKSSTLFEHISHGRSPLVILNDVRAVEDVRNAFRELVRSIFIFRHNPSSDIYHQELIDSRGKEAAEPRFQKAQTIFRIYIENIHLFDHVIVNSGYESELRTQVAQIVKGLEDPNWPLRKRG